jgi:hypothetical protein
MTCAVSVASARRKEADSAAYTIKFFANGTAYAIKFRTFKAAYAIKFIAFRARCRHNEEAHTGIGLLAHISSAHIYVCIAASGFIYYGVAGDIPNVRKVTGVSINNSYIRLPVKIRVGE